MLAFVELTGKVAGALAGPTLDGEGFRAVVQRVPVPCALT